MRTLYLECKSGISGDMTVAALLDLGADREKLQKVIDEMDVGAKLHFKSALRNDITVYNFMVEMPDGHIDGVCEGHHHHDHDHHDHDHHDHDHDHHDHHHDKYHAHRNLNDVYAIIETSGLNEKAKEMSKKMFRIVAEAEAKAHNKPIEEVHFHEVGAIDSIVDICAVAFCIDDLGIDRVVVSPLAEGQGTVKCAHGLVPVPAPATAAICSTYGVPLNFTENEGEMVTPTGAAIVAAYADEFGSPSGNSVIKKIGYGAGKREFKYAVNMLRAMLIEENDRSEYEDSILLIETNIDDCSSECLGYCLEKLFEAGVKDAYFTPIFMKKNRPAYSLSVMCKEDVKDEALRIIFANTSSVGARVSSQDRVIMKREAVTVDTPYGPVEGKKCTYGDIEKVTIEYESAKKLANEKGISITKIFESK